MHSKFPDPGLRRDLVAFGEDLRVETLRDAYRHGIFPWPHEGMPLPWFSPRRRTVILFDELHRRAYLDAVRVTRRRGTACRPRRC